eukprot:6156625-Lingulodinium_polyedra.AAC.1
MGAVRELRLLSQQWTCRLFAIEYVGIELDFFSKKAFVDKMAVQVPHVGDEELDTTKPLVSPDDKSLRSIAQNAVAVSAMVLSCPINKRLVKCIVLMADK